MYRAPTLVKSKLLKLGFFFDEGFAVERFVGGDYFVGLVARDVVVV